MAADGPYTDLCDLTTCQVCLEEFGERNPRALPCLHVFCEACLQELADVANRRRPSSRDTVTCPVCSRRAEIPGGSAANLPLFFHSRKIDDVRKRFEQRRRSCDLCQTSTGGEDVSRYCIKCSSKMCASCSDKHDRLYGSHGKVKVTPLTVDSLLCSEHGVHRQCYCVTCSTAVCVKCHVGTHDGHRVSGITYEGVWRDRGLERRLVSEMRTAKTAIARMNSLQDDAESHAVGVRMTLRRHRDLLKKQIDDRYDALCSELDEKTLSIVQEIDGVKKRIERTSSCIQGLLEEAKRLNEPIPGIAEASVVDVDQLSREIENRIPEVDADIDPPAKLKFVPETNPISVGEIVEEGKTLRRHVSISPVEDFAYLGNDRLVVVSTYGLGVHGEDGVQLLDELTEACGGSLYGVAANDELGIVAVTQGTGADERGWLHVCEKGDDEWTHDAYPVCKWPWRVAVTKSGRFVLSSNTEDKLYKYDRKGRFLGCIYTRGWAHALCVDDDDRIIVCLGNDVHIYDEDGAMLFSLRTEDRQLSPYDVCVDADNRDIFVSDATSKSILLFSEKGTFLRKVVSMNWCPNKIAVNSNKQLAISEFDKNDIYIYTL